MPQAEVLLSFRCLYRIHAKRPSTHFTLDIIKRTEGVFSLQQVYCYVLREGVG